MNNLFENLNELKSFTLNEEADYRRVVSCIVNMNLNIE